MRRRTESLAVYVGKIAFLRIDSGEHRVGFSLGSSIDAGPDRSRAAAGAMLAAALWWRKNPRHARTGSGSGWKRLTRDHAGPPARSASAGCR